jgi:hypothetical protein
MYKIDWTKLISFLLSALIVLIILISILRAERPLNPETDLTVWQFRFGKLESGTLSDSLIRFQDSDTLKIAARCLPPVTFVPKDLTPDPIVFAIPTDSLFINVMNNEVNYDESKVRIVINQRFEPGEWQAQVRVYAKNNTVSKYSDAAGFFIEKLIPNKPIIFIFEY